MQRLSSLLAVAALAAVASAQTLVVPSVAAAADGNSSTSWPFDVATMRIQYIYDSSHFTNNGVTFPILINQIRYRANASTTTWTGSSGTLQMDLSTAPFDFLAITNTFASNHGADQTNVYNGPLTCNAGSSTTGTPGPFYTTVTFSQPFLYDPSQGDLVIDTTHAGLTIANTPTLDCVTTTGVALATRMQTTTVGNPTGTIWSGELANVLEFTYTPAAGLYSIFSASATTGASPLSVNFTDGSYSSAPGGVTSWAWDFDGDNVIDSTLQNPTFVYGACGTYTVSLTVTDSQHPAATETKTGYIVVDPIAAGFSVSAPGGFAPLAVNFTDSTTGTVTGWAWDFDGDTIVDSTLQNPTFVYATPGTYSVTLTANNGCRSSSVTRNNLVTVLAPGSVPAPAELMQYQFNEVRGQEVGNSASTNAAPRQGTVNVASWSSDPGRADFRGNEPGFGCLGYRATGGGSVNTGFPMSITGSFSISFWMKRDPASVIASPFGYAFGNGTFRAFTGSAGIQFAGSSIGTVLSGFTIHTTPGVWQHLILVVDDNLGQARWYDNGVPSATVVNFTPNTFSYTSTANLAIGAISTAGGSPFAAHFHMDDFRFYTRALTGVEAQLLALLPEDASAGVSGLSCPGPSGVPVIGSTGGLPTQGNSSFAVTLSNAENLSLAGIAFGFTPAAFGTFDLSPWLGAGCVLQNDATALNFLITSGNAATQPFAMPAGPGFAGLHIYAQWAVLGTVGAASKMLDINIR